MSKYEEMADTQEGQAVLKIIKDLEDRQGLGDEWDQIDDSIKREIFEAWFHIILESNI